MSALRIDNNFFRFWTIILLFTISGLFSQYFLTTVIAGFVLATLIELLYVRHTPAMLLYYFIFCWLQVFTAIPYAIYSKTDLNILFESNFTEQLIRITFLQITLMALIAAFYLRKDKLTFTINLLKAEAEKLNIRNILLAFLIATLVFPPLIAITQSNGSLNQLVRSAAIVRSILIILLLFIVFLRKTPYNTLIIIIVILEFFLGFVSYFSSFKDVIFYFLFTYLVVNPKIKLKAILFVIPVIVLLSYVMIFWSYTKSDYREFLSGGERQQIVVVNKSDALNYLYDKFAKFNSDNFDEGVSTLLGRIQFISYYALTEKRIPAVRSHADGWVTENAIKFLFLPRFLNPDKGILDPSKKTTYYTGINFASAAEGTSIPLGYFCDFFIDYGFFGMFFPLALISIILSNANTYLLKIKKYNLLFTFAIIISLFISLGTFETDVIYFLGSIRNAVAVFIIANYLVLPRLNRYLLN